MLHRKAAQTGPLIQNAHIRATRAYYVLVLRTSVSRWLSLCTCHLRRALQPLFAQSFPIAAINPLPPDLCRDRRTKKRAARRRLSRHPGESKCLVAWEETVCPHALFSLYNDLPSGARRKSFFEKRNGRAPHAFLSNKTLRGGVPGIRIPFPFDPPQSPITNGGGFVGWSQFKLG